MQYLGQISKMVSSLGDPINYQLPIGKNLINMNNLLGTKIYIEYNSDKYKE